MKILFLTVISLLMYLPEKDSKPSLNEIRELFFNMDRDSSGALSLFESISSESYDDPIMQAYAGATEAAAAECVDGAFNKLEYFSRGKKNLENAVERAPQNPEIRFLRFITQTNLPDFITYDNIREDKSLILEHLPQLMEDDQQNWFWIEAAQVMADSGKLNKKEKELLEQLLRKNK